MEYTKIQWCDSTVNPVMGCDGCELWPNQSQVRSAIISCLQDSRFVTRQEVVEITDTILGGMSPSEIWHCRMEVAEQLSAYFPTCTIELIMETIEALFRCYAGILHLRHGADPTQPEKRVNSGYAPFFESPRAFAGRMENAADWSDLGGTPRFRKPWLCGLPRLIFISDMGDALSRSISFEFLEQEIVQNVHSEAGRRHIWLWVTKRPGKMADFGRWLVDNRSTAWPDNLVAITTVTGQATLNRVDELRNVPARYRGLSVEPLQESVQLDLDGVDWVIVGGESGSNRHPFDLAWARDLQMQCRTAGVPYFVKQLGAVARDRGDLTTFAHTHGSDWAEWPEDLRVREMPQFFIPKWDSDEAAEDGEIDETLPFNFAG